MQPLTKPSSALSNKRLRSINPAKNRSNIINNDNIVITTFKNITTNTITYLIIKSKINDSSPAIETTSLNNYFLPLDYLTFQSYHAHNFRRGLFIVFLSLPLLLHNQYIFNYTATLSNSSSL